MQTDRPRPTSIGPLVSVAVLALVVILGGCRDEAAQRSVDVLRVGISAQSGGAAPQARYARLTEHLSRNLGVPVKLAISRNDAGLADLFAQGKIDLAHFGGVEFVNVSARPGAVPLVMRDVDAHFTSAFLVKAGSAANSLADMRGARFAFGSKSSVAGHLMPRYYLEEEGIEPESFFSSVVYSGAPLQTAYLVRDGIVDVGVVNSRVARQMLKDGRLSANDVRVLWQTPPYADYVWAIQPDIEAPLRKGIRDAFLELSPGDAQGRRILESLAAGRFLPSAMQDFARLQAVVDQTRAQRR